MNSQLPERGESREHILENIVGVVREILETRPPQHEVLADSQLVRDLGFESIDYVFLVERLTAEHSLNFVSWLSGLTAAQIESLRISDIVEYISAAKGASDRSIGQRKSIARADDELLQAPP